MELLRITAYQPFACYRKPFSYGFWDTFPLPPYSTILGWVQWVIEAQAPLPIGIGIVGKFESITYDLQTLIKFDRVRKEKDQIVIPTFNKALSRSPTYTANVTDIHLRIYLAMEKSKLELFRDRVMLRNYPSLGRYEDLMRIDDIRLVRPTTKKISHFDPPIPIKYSVYLRQETAKVSGNQGSIVRMPTYHDLISGKRFFRTEKAVYLDSGYFGKGEFLFDDDRDELFDGPVIVDLFGNSGNGLR